ncbi:hypothetical protein LEP1GSC076_1593 [Leptospira sp. Fiocruz LV4135]|nr:hypothetical protein LEP1GSC076_1593 [Leptospira sp. Fiocruz LV4135]
MSYYFLSVRFAETDFFLKVLRQARSFLRFVSKVSGKGKPRYS